MATGPIEIVYVLTIPFGLCWFQNPWHTPLFPPTYLMNESTIVEPCTTDAWSNATFFSQFGIVNYDWSNAKAEWSAAKPMDCQERLVKQAAMTKAANPKTKTWVCKCCSKWPVCHACFTRLNEQD